MYSDNIFDILEYDPVYGTMIYLFMLLSFQFNYMATT